VKEKADEVVPPGIPPDIETSSIVRHPGHRMPVGAVVLVKAQATPPPVQSAKDVRVVGDVDVVVVVEEAVRRDARKTPPT